MHHWQHDIIMMTSSNGDTFRVTGHSCGHRWIPLTKTSDAEFCCEPDVCLNKHLNKQSWGWWFDRPSRSLWRNCNDPPCMEYSWTKTWLNLWIVNTYTVVHRSFMVVYDSYFRSVIMQADIDVLNFDGIRLPTNYNFYVFYKYCLTIGYFESFFYQVIWSNVADDSNPSWHLEC